MLDEPAYATLFQNLPYVRLTEPDEFTVIDTGRIVYHDVFGDYSTNQPIMDGTANLTYLLGGIRCGDGAAQRLLMSRAGRPPRMRRVRRCPARQV